MNIKLKNLAKKIISDFSEINILVNERKKTNLKKQFVLDLKFIN